MKNKVGAWEGAKTPTNGGGRGFSKTKKKGGGSNLGQRFQAVHVFVKWGVGQIWQVKKRDGKEKGGFTSDEGETGETENANPRRAKTATHLPLIFGGKGKQGDDPRTR